MIFNVISNLKFLFVHIINYNCIISVVYSWKWKRKRKTKKKRGKYNVIRRNKCLICFKLWEKTNQNPWSCALWCHGRHKCSSLVGCFGGIAVVDAGSPCEQCTYYYFLESKDVCTTCRLSKITSPSDLQQLECWASLLQEQ